MGKLGGEEKEKGERRERIVSWSAEKWITIDHRGV